MVRKIRWPKVTRDTVLFTCGLAGIAHETLIAHVERPSLLFVFTAMVGLPAFLRSDERKTNGSPPSGAAPQPPDQPAQPQPPAPPTGRASAR